MERPSLEESLLQAFNSTELERLPPYKKRDIAQVVEIVLKRDGHTETSAEQKLGRLTKSLEETAAEMAAGDAADDHWSTGRLDLAQELLKELKS